MWCSSPKYSLTDMEPYLFNCAAFIFELFSGLSMWYLGIQKDFFIEGKSGKKQFLILKVYVAFGMFKWVWMYLLETLHYSQCYNTIKRDRTHFRMGEELHSWCTGGINNILR